MKFIKNGLRLMLSTLVFAVTVGLTSTTFADSVDYNSVDVGALQSQYQYQLKPKAIKKSRVVKKAVRRTAPRRSQTSAQELRQYQQLLARQQQTKNQQQVQLAQRRAQLQRQQQLRLQQQRQQAKAQQRPQAVQRLVQRQVQQQPQTQRPAPRRDALFEAASSGNVRLIGQLLQQGMNVNQANNEGETALHMAAAKGHYSAVIYLLNHGANINSRTVNNWLPIHHATRFRHAQIANYLKQRGSPIYARTSDGLSAVDMAKAVNDRRIMGIFGVR